LSKTARLHGPQSRRRTGGSPPLRLANGASARPQPFPFPDHEPGRRGGATRLDAGGLLTSLTDQHGGLHVFQYDSVGRLTRDEDRAGGSKSLTRTDSATGYSETASTALGRTNTYTVETLSSGSVRRVSIDPSGATTVTVLGTDARQWRKSLARTTSSPSGSWRRSRRSMVSTCGQSPASQPGVGGR
jgi:YD repeat-containing protein